MKNIFEKILFVIGWIRIFLSPTLGGVLLAAIIYGNKQNETGATIGTIFIVFGIVLGILAANKVCKKQDPIEFLSRVDASPDLDNLKQEHDGK